jgi:hypothetical protein
MPDRLPKIMRDIAPLRPATGILVLHVTEEATNSIAWNALDGSYALPGNFPDIFAGRVRYINIIRTIAILFSGATIIATYHLRFLYGHE